MHFLNSFIAFLFVFWLAASDAAKYAGRFDKLDIDEILRSDRLLKNYFDCLMEKGPCTPEGSELKRTIPEALKTDCSKCTDSQRKKAGKAINFLEEHKPDMYDQLEKKYDPEHLYRSRHKKNTEKTANQSVKKSTRSRTRTSASTIYSAL